MDALIGYINHCQVSWVVLNACWSDALINKLLLATSADLLVMTGSVLDKDAWRFARLVAYELAKHGDIRRAIESIAPGQLGRHCFYRNDKGGNMQENTTCIEERLDLFINDMSIIGQRVAAIEAKLNGVEENVDAQHSCMFLWYIAAMAGAFSLAILLAHMYYT